MRAQDVHTHKAADRRGETAQAHSARFAPRGTGAGWIALLSLCVLGACADADKPSNQVDATIDPSETADGGRDAAAASDGDSATDRPDHRADGGPDSPQVRGADELIADASAALCGALARCCDQGSISDWFGGYAARYEQNEALQALAAELPPRAPFDADSCPSKLAKMLEVVPFGKWVSAVRAGDVAYDAKAAAVCLDTLQNASCGDELGAALYDGTCLSYSPPFGGSEQRTMFSRTKSPGAACTTLNDGIGGLFYGTCEPSAAFCCIEDAAGECTVPSGNNPQGTCRAAAGEGEACSMLPPFLLCKTGAECVNDRCVIPQTGDLTVGEACMDANFVALGDCKESYCESSSSRCEPLVKDGAACLFPFECESGACVERLCGAPTFCTGPELDGMAADAGVTDSGTVPAPDAGTAELSVSTLDVKLASPHGLTLGADGTTLYVADQNRHVVRSIAADGTLSEIGMLTNATPYLGGYVDGASAGAQFRSPWGLASAADGTLYVSDTGNRAIRRVSFTGGAVVSTLVGGPESTIFKNPKGVAVDENGDLLVVDGSICKLVRIAKGDGQITPVLDATACVGVSADARLYLPAGLAYRAATRDVFVSSVVGQRIYRVHLGADSASTSVDVIAGSSSGESGHVDGAGLEARFNGPQHLAIDTDGALLVADSNNHVLRRVAEVAGEVVVSTIAGTPGSAGSSDGHPLREASFTLPTGLVVARDGTIYVSESNGPTSRLRRIGR